MTKYYKISIKYSLEDIKEPDRLYTKLEVYSKLRSIISENKDPFFIMIKYVGHKSK